MAAEGYRERCLSEKGTDCLLCGASGRVVVHHINGDRTDDDLDNLMPVCTMCHSKIHHGHDGYEMWYNQLRMESRIGVGPSANPGKMRAEVDMDPGDELHEAVTAYANAEGIRHPRAYAELIEAGLEHEGDGT